MGRSGVKVGWVDEVVLIMTMTMMMMTMMVIILMITMIIPGSHLVACCTSC